MNDFGPSTGFKRLDEDSIIIIIVKHKNVFVSTSGGDRKTPSNIRVDDSVGVFVIDDDGKHGVSLLAVGCEIFEGVVGL